MRGNGIRPLPCENNRVVLYEASDRSFSSPMWPSDTHESRINNHDHQRKRNEHKTNENEDLHLQSL
jgi:hypothetical protein